MTNLATSYKPAAAVSDPLVIETVMVFTAQPSNTPPSQIMSPVVVTVRDGSGHTVTGFTGDINLAIQNNPSGGVLSGTTTVSAVAGVSTFSTLSINAVGSGYTLKASSDDISDVTSSSFAIGQVLTAVDLGNSTFGMIDSFGGSIDPATYNGATIKEIWSDTINNITNVVMSGTRAQDFFASITIAGGATLDTADADDFSAGGSQTVWGWNVGTLVTSTGDKLVTIS